MKARKVTKVSVEEEDWLHRSVPGRDQNQTHSLQEFHFLTQGSLQIFSCTGAAATLTLN